MGVVDIIHVLRRLALASRARAHPDRAIERLSASKPASHGLLSTPPLPKKTAYAYVSASRHVQAQARQLIIEALQTFRYKSDASFVPSLRDIRAEDDFVAGVVKRHTTRMEFYLAQQDWDWWRTRRLELIDAGELEPHKDCTALHERWEYKTYELYGDFQRDESTALLQIRTEAIGLNCHLHLLRKRDTMACPCGADKQTAMHILRDCPDFEEQRYPLIEHIRNKCSYIRDSDHELASLSAGSPRAHRVRRNLELEWQRQLLYGCALDTARWALRYFPNDAFVNGQKRIEALAKKVGETRWIGYRDKKPDGKRNQNGPPGKGSRANRR